MDDNKISHKKEKVVEEVIKKIEERFGKMTTTKEDDLEFLGMKLKFRKGKGWGWGLEERRPKISTVWWLPCYTYQEGVDWISRRRWVS